MDFEGGDGPPSEKDLRKREKQKAKMNKMGSHRKKKHQKTVEEQMEEGKSKSRTTGDGSLSYGEFFVSLWNFCTLTHETLVKFAFDLYGKQGGGCLILPRPPQRWAPSHR